MIRILLADDHEVVRHGLRGLLEAEPGWQVVAEASTSHAAVTLAGWLRPDVVVLELSMPELGGLEAIRRIRRDHPQVEILVFTRHNSDQLVREALLAGARG